MYFQYLGKSASLNVQKLKFFVPHGMTWCDMVWDGTTGTTGRFLHIVIKGRGEGRVKLHWRFGNVEDFENVWIEGKPLLFSKLPLGEDRPSQVLSNQINAFMKKILNIVMVVWTIDHSEQSRWSCSIFNPTMQYLCWCSSCLEKIL